jgi:hypothetical protein
MHILYKLKVKHSYCFHRRIEDAKLQIGNEFIYKLRLFGPTTVILPFLRSLR